MDAVFEYESRMSARVARARVDAVGDTVAGPWVSNTKRKVDVTANTATYRV
jgi:hypothetical protein